MTEKKVLAEKPPLADKNRKTPSLKMTRDETGALEIAPRGDFDRLNCAVANLDVSAGLMMQVAALGFHGNQMDERAVNFALGFVDSMQPRDAAEAALLAQMAAIHQATMAMARRLNHVDNIQQQDAAERSLNKLTRSYAAQMKALKGYRSKGQQTVRVERVTVQDGGQAIVGNVERGGGGDDET
ncbi:hypothetical protein [Roseovarius sp. D0-M9]|uniref:hypothetical protein n=1 Tax=Roseovarius sp. D0-M9 TaxID=3127117 RepID=UPI0030102795